MFANVRFVIQLEARKARPITRLWFRTVFPSGTLRSLSSVVVSFGLGHALIGRDIIASILHIFKPHSFPNMQDARTALRIGSDRITVGIAVLGQPHKWITLSGSCSVAIEIVHAVVVSGLFRSLNTSSMAFRARYLPSEVLQDVARGRLRPGVPCPVSRTLQVMSAPSLLSSAGCVLSCPAEARACAQFSDQKQNKH